MKISFDLRFAHFPGGGGVYTRQLLQALVHEEPQHVWRIYHNPWCATQRQIIQQINEPELSLYPVNSTCLSLKQHWEFHTLADDSDIYHYPHFDMPLLWKGRRLVITIHDLHPLTVPNYCSPLKRAYFKYIIGRNARRAARIITISQCSKRDIIEHLNISPDKIDIVPQGYSYDYCPITDSEKLEAVREKYELPQNFIFYTGNHKIHKNLARLFEAFAGLPQNLQNKFPLVLTGPFSPETDQLRGLAEKLNIISKVNFLGLVDFEELPALYNLASLLVLPSIYEGFGFSPLEALACGTPVACSNATAIPEVVGTAGRLFDPYNVEEMTATLKVALEQDVNDSGVREKCLERARQFSWPATARKTLDVYRRYLER